MGRMEKTSPILNILVILVGMFTCFFFCIGTECSKIF
jgi:hypothetical protein